MPKRQTLADFEAEVLETPQAPTTTIRKVQSVHKTVYIPPAVLDQLDQIASQERNAAGRGRTFTSMVLEGLDLFFKSRGLQGVDELTEK